jgi:hypothetical protein
MKPTIFGLEPTEFAVARFRLLGVFVESCLGANAPGFMLSPAPQAENLSWCFYQRTLETSHSLEDEVVLERSRLTQASRR